MGPTLHDFVRAVLRNSSKKVPKGLGFGSGLNV